MRRFSRWMPPMPPPPPMTLKAWLILAGLLSVLLFPVVIAAVESPVAVAVTLAAVFGLFLVLLLVGIIEGNRRLRRLAVERAGEDIGSFARSFDRRKEPFDPWVVRATWDALKPYSPFLRPTDRLEEDLGIDMHDLDINEVLLEVAARSGRSLDEIKNLEGIQTVEDFVRLITVQPRLQR